ncbi:uncharacterized protein TNCV_3789911 [Trichonephila clavipes]|nr:uncharacterized protein TNCV_3789911 [Trichonephila clavipes]
MLWLTPSNTQHSIRTQFLVDWYLLLLTTLFIVTSELRGMRSPGSAVALAQTTGIHTKDHIKRGAAVPFETGIHFRRKTDFFPEEDTTKSYSGFEPEPIRLQAEDHSHHTGWATNFFNASQYRNCDENKTVVNTSLKSVQTSHDVNLRITQAFSHIGKGYSAIEKFCMVMNIDPFSSTTYGKCARRLDNAYTLASENIFAEIHREIKNVYENGAEITDLSVSFDGTWLTRGHTSLIGVGCVIDMLTGYVVDFEVMSKVCRHCSVAKNKLGQSSAEFSIWYEGHKSECDINHLGSSTSMEMEAALTLWKKIPHHLDSVILQYYPMVIVKLLTTCARKKCMDLTL